MIGHKMLIFNQIKEIQDCLNEYRKNGKTIGFVPTMGALHDGHISLVQRAAEENDRIVVSIFVNPTQFNNPEDLKTYPRMPEKDQAMLSENNVDVLFSPNVNEMYHDGLKPKNKLPLGRLAEVMEGAQRPGHFDGVVQVVSKLFEIVKPEKAYFGEKDFQQLAVIRHMTKQLNFPVEIIGCPTVREKSGLAMSSRNLRLSPGGLKAAPSIYEALHFASVNWKKFSPDELKQETVRRIESSGKLKVEYVEIADEATLETVAQWQGVRHARVFAAVFCEGVRLIDNVGLKI